MYRRVWGKEALRCINDRWCLDQEEFNGVIQMSHVSHVELGKLVTFFYQMDYSDDIPDGTELSSLQLHVRIFALADQYDIPNLATVAAKKYTSECNGSWIPTDSLASILDIYETTPACIRKLRDLACLFARKHLPQMLNDESTASLYRETLSNSPDFANDLLASYVNNTLYGHCATCQSSQPMEALQTRCKRCGKGNSGGCLYA